MFLSLKTKTISTIRPFFSKQILSNGCDEVRRLHFQKDAARPSSRNHSLCYPPPPSEMKKFIWSLYVVTFWGTQVAHFHPVDIHRSSRQPFFTCHGHPMGQSSGIVVLFGKDKNCGIIFSISKKWRVPLFTHTLIHKQQIYLLFSFAT